MGCVHDSDVLHACPVQGYWRGNLLRGKGLQAAHHMASHAHLSPELARLPLPLFFCIHFALPLTQALAALHATLQLCTAALPCSSCFAASERQPGDRDPASREQGRGQVCIVWAGKKRACKRPLPESPLSMILANARAKDAALLSGRASLGSRGPPSRSSASTQCSL